MTIEAIKAIQMVYANTTKHDWPDDIWDAICQAIEAEKHEVSQEPVACKEDDVGNLEYRGNSVGYIFQKMTAYKKGIVDVWDALKSIGVHPDGKTSAPDAIRNLYIHPQPKREWVGLTEDDWVRIYSHADNSVGRAAELAEEILKDKNGF